jgi:UDP-N-acetylmuramoyl-tripeptide--D-alanyl-D-alanine ligase
VSVPGWLDNPDASLGWVATAASAATALLAGIRWLRVAQREHYLPGATSRFALRWTASIPRNMVLAAVATAGVVAAAVVPVGGVATALAVAFLPVGLGLRGRTAPLRWTRRLATVATIGGVLAAAAVGVGARLGAGPVAAAAVALGVPVVVDLALVLDAPLERRILDRHVRRAQARLAAVGPRVAAITGSYGKTTTKHAAAHLLASTFSALASPASYNNRAGLARAINEQLADGTEIFVAEMGAYGPGEIRSLCEWLVPEVAAITAIGPVHLERFGSEERILEAKAEILERAKVVVLPIDDERLAHLAARCEREGKEVIRCSAPARDHEAPAGVPGAQADVEVRNEPAGLELWVRGERVAVGLALPLHARNLAVAVGIALAFGVEPSALAGRLQSIPPVAHRLEQGEGASGCLVLDDTYNSNPAGALAALERLQCCGRPGRKVVVSPGMVELGPRQHEENARFAEAAAEVATHVFVVGRTNARAFAEGLERARRGGHAPEVRFVPRLADAVAWVRATLGPDDAVLYENDLPDHYP